MEDSNSSNIGKFKGTYTKIGANIKKFRTEKGWTQQNLADRCDGITRAKISKIENAYEDYMFSTLLEVCDALGKTLSDISKGEIEY